MSTCVTQPESPCLSSGWSSDSGCPKLFPKCPVWLAKFHHTSFSSPHSHCHQLFSILTQAVVSFFILTQPPHLPHISYASYFQPPFTQIYSGFLFIPFLLVCYTIPFQQIPSLNFDCVFLKRQCITSRISFFMRKFMPGSYERHGNKSHCILGKTAGCLFMSQGLAVPSNM